MLVARAFVPVGFMAQAHDGKMQVVMCSAWAALPGVHDDRTGNNLDHQHGDFSCPFAHAAAAPLLDVGGNIEAALVPFAEILPPADTPYCAVGPPRFIATRGPPVYV